MRPIEILVLFINLLTFFSLAMPQLRASRWMCYWAPLGLLIAGAQALVEGPRWQMIPAYVLSGLFFLVWLPQNISSLGKPVGRRWINRLVAGLAIGLGTFGLMLSIISPILFPIFRFPHPTGPYMIGTLTYHWVDADRPEVFTADPNARHELMVQIWYPARAGASSPRAPYLQEADAITPTLARLSHLPAFTSAHLKYITTNAIVSAPLAEEEPAYPILIFLEGFTGFR